MNCHFLWLALLFTTLHATAGSNIFFFSTPPNITNFTAPKSVSLEWIPNSTDVPISINFKKYNPTTGSFDGIFTYFAVNPPGNRVLLNIDPARMDMYGTGTLRINATTPNDGGQYKCEVQSSNAVYSSIVTLVSLGDPPTSSQQTFQNTNTFSAITPSHVSDPLISSSEGISNDLSTSEPMPQRSQSSHPPSSVPVALGTSSSFLVVTSPPYVQASASTGIPTASPASEPSSTELGQSSSNSYGSSVSLGTSKHLSTKISQSLYSTSTAIAVRTDTRILGPSTSVYGHSKSFLGHSSSFRARTTSLKNSLAASSVTKSSANPTSSPGISGNGSSLAKQQRVAIGFGCSMIAVFVIFAILHYIGRKPRERDIPAN